MKRNTTIDYQIESEGKLKMEVKNWANSWSSMLWLNIESGKKYYIKIDCNLSGITLSSNSSTGEEEWNEVSKSNLVTLMEDPNVLIIDKPEVNETTIVKVKTDTVKQIVYVNAPQQENRYSFKRLSDVDRDIPKSIHKNDMTFALIIGNEDYTSFQKDLSSEVNVAYAKNDANAFNEYAQNTLGIPEKNITLLQDATYGQMQQALNKLNLITKTTNGNAKLVFYYAGHGMPDEQSKEPYLMPVDVSGSNISSGLKLTDVYAKLTEHPVKQVVVILDACFTGGGRNQGLLAARGIAIKPKEHTLKGNIVVLSSSSGNQSSLPYDDKKHGMYTYYLLKKLKESQGNASLNDISTYLSNKVSLDAVLINNKEQNPQVNVGEGSQASWENWSLIK